MIYIRNYLSYKSRNDLEIYKSFEPESTFTEICNPKKTNIVIGCIYKHPNMDINEFNEDYLNTIQDGPFRGCSGMEGEQKVPPP